MDPLRLILTPCGVPEVVWEYITEVERKSWHDVPAVANFVHGDKVSVVDALIFCHELAREAPEDPIRVWDRWNDVLSGVMEAVAMHALSVPEEGRSNWRTNIRKAMLVDVGVDVKKYTPEETPELYFRSNRLLNR